MSSSAVRGLATAARDRTPSSAPSRPVVRVQARSEAKGWAEDAKPWGMAAGVAAAALVATSPAEAGVILEQPRLKRFDSSPAATQQKSASQKRESSASGGFSLDLGFVSLPLTLGGCVAIYVAGSKLDGDFESFMSKAWLKDSNVNGIGYEELYKSTDYTSGGKLRKP